MDDERRRARELGLALGPYPTGPHNAITDVTGVLVGQVTLAEGQAIRTGVTAVVPQAVVRADGSRPLPAGLFVGNGYGKLTGATQVAELGQIETPVLLTGTLSTFRVADALVTYMLALPGNDGMISVNPVVGETNDGYLSDIRARPVSERHVLAALSDACGGPVAEGAVGAGTGTSALGFKAGIGTASRRLHLPGAQPCTLGVLVQSNFPGRLTVRGVPIAAPGGALSEPNSCMIVIAIDQRLDSRQLTRVARRAVFAMSRTGADFAGSSGDYAIAFATAAAAPVPETALEPVFGAVQDAVEEAILNSLFMASTMTGYLGHVSHAVPLDLVIRTCREAGMLGS